MTAERHSASISAVVLSLGDCCLFVASPRSEYGQ